MFSGQFALWERDQTVFIMLAPYQHIPADSDESAIVRIWCHTLTVKTGCWSLLSRACTFRNYTNQKIQVWNNFLLSNLALLHVHNKRQYVLCKSSIRNILFSAFVKKMDNSFHLKCLIVHRIQNSLLLKKYIVCFSVMDTNCEFCFCC